MGSKRGVTKELLLLPLQHKTMIVITGAAGFIASRLARFFNRVGVVDLLLVDDFSSSLKAPNWEPLQYEFQVPRHKFPEWLGEHHQQVDFVFHLGARTDTTEFDYSIFQELNVSYSKAIWELCTQHQIPLIYASSAATYGDGKLGYIDNEGEIPQLKPLNPYGQSKQVFDEWVLQQDKTPPFWAGLKFFNVYGPNEYHKGRMASVVYHTYMQILKSGKMTLFRSHNPMYKDGEQQRDFIFVEDVINIMHFLYTNQPQSGIYNAGTGEARTFMDLATQVFVAMGLEPQISFMDTPADIRDNYQYFTQADMAKLMAAGFDKPFTTLEEGVNRYVKDYLQQQQK